jgi:ribosomal protein S18 acetylase RimI-like enzyme
MQTHYLGSEQVKAYLVDLAQRLRLLDKEAPSIWVPIGPSGRELVKALIDANKDLDEKFVPAPAEFDRTSGKVVFEKSASKLIKGKKVLVIDSSVHSGATMHAVIKKLAEMGATGICSYTLVLKSGAKFVPSFWGVSIGDYDRAYFLLDSLPNNHFHDSGPAFGQVRERPRPAKAGRDPYFHIRKLSKADIDRPVVRSGTKSLDRTTWADRYYDMVSHHERSTYLLEGGEKIFGYVTFDHKHDGSLSIEAVAVGKRYRDRGYGAALIRWAETSARQKDCRSITMWAIKEQQERYKRLGYNIDPDRPAMMLDGEEYQHMSKPVLYHL